MLTYMDQYDQQQNTPPGHDPYGFIMDTQHQKVKKSLGDQNSLKTRIFVAAGAAFVLIFVFIILNALVFNKKDPNSVLLINIAAEQQEITRVSELGVKGATDPATKNYVHTVKLSVMTQQQELSAYMSKNGIKALPADLAAKKDTTIDDRLTAATKSNRFNETFDETIKKSLVEYKTDLEKAYNNASSPTSKALLKKAYNSTAELLK